MLWTPTDAAIWLRERKPQLGEDVLLEGHTSTAEMDRELERVGR